MDGQFEDVLAQIQRVGPYAWPGQRVAAVPEFHRTDPALLQRSRGSGFVFREDREKQRAPTWGQIFAQHFHLASEEVAQPLEILAAPSPDGGVVEPSHESL